MKKKSLILVLFVVLTGCSWFGGNGPDGLKPNDLVVTLKNAGWTPLAFPDGVYQPGSVFRFVQGEAPDYLGTLNPEDCGIPADRLSITSSYVPTLETNTQYDASLNLAATIKGIGVSAGLFGDRGAIVKIEEQGVDQIDVVRLRIWLTNNRNKVHPTCLEWIEKENHYLVRRAFAIRKGEMKFFQKVGGKLEVLNKIQVLDWLKLGGELKGNLKDDGTLIFNNTAYIAVRGVQNLITGMELLGDTTAPTTDAQDIEKALIAYGSKQLSVPR